MQIAKHNYVDMQVVVVGLVFYLVECIKLQIIDHYYIKQPFPNYTEDSNQYNYFHCGHLTISDRISVTALLQQLQWPSLADRRLIARLTLFYNAHTEKTHYPIVQYYG